MGKTTKHNAIRESIHSFLLAPASPISRVLDNHPIPLRRGVSTKYISVGEYVGPLTNRCENRFQSLKLKVSMISSYYWIIVKFVISNLYKYQKLVTYMVDFDWDFETR